MESLNYGLTNTELAQVESYVKEITPLFDKDFKKYSDRKAMYLHIKNLSRFAIAREFKREKVIDMWKKWVQWYEDYRPDLLSSEDPVIKKIHTSGKYRYAGVDNDGCPILIIRMRYHVKGLATADENLKYLIYMIENGVKLAD